MLSIDANNNITLTRGDTLTASATPKVRSTGEAYEPQEGDTFRFAISKGYEGEVGYKFMCEAVISSDTWIFTIPASETKKLDYTTYNYDAQATFANGVVDTYISGKLTITGETK